MRVLVQRGRRRARWWAAAIGIAAGSAAGAEGCSSGTTTGCGSDVDCKGDRVCVDGQCVSPGAGGSTGTAATGPGGSGSTSSGGPSTSSGGPSTTSSSSSSSASGGGIGCTTLSTDDCACYTNGVGDMAMACSVASLGGSGVCCSQGGWPTPPASSCVCFKYACTTNTLECFCTLSSMGTTAACPGTFPHCCASPSSGSCTCSAAACAAGIQVEVSTCAYAEVSAAQTAAGVPPCSTGTPEPSGACH